MFKKKQTPQVKEELELSITLENLRTIVKAAVEGRRIMTTWTDEQVIDKVMANLTIYRD